MHKDDLKILKFLDGLAQTQDDLTAAENRVEELRQLREAKILDARKLGAKNVQIARAIGKTDQFVHWVFQQNKKAE